MTPDNPSGSHYRSAYLLSILVFLVLVGLHFEPDGKGFTRLIEFGEHWEDRQTQRMEGLNYWVKPDSHGYDGQFYAKIALDPTLQTEDYGTAIDGPGYRGRRILLPAMAWLMGFGNPTLVLQIYALLNVAFWLALAWLLLRFIPKDESPRVRFMRWFGVMFSLGVLDSVGLALTDLPMLFLVLAALLLFRNGQHFGGGIGLALAILTRETAALAAIAQPGLYPPERRAWIRASLIGGLACLPLAAWILYLTDLWGQNPGTRGNFTFPFFQVANTAWKF